MIKKGEFRFDGLKINKDISCPSKQQIERHFRDQLQFDFIEQIKRIVTTGVKSCNISIDTSSGIDNIDTEII